MKKAVIYGRVSSTGANADRQDYSRQLHDLNRYARDHKYQVVESFTEKISGTKRTDQRKEYSRMLEYLNNNKDVKTILVTELSRFGRLGTKTKLEIENLAEKGINIYFQDRGINSVDKDGKPNSDTMMIIGILCDFAKKEIETLKHRIKSGLRYSAVNGGAGGGAVKAYGYQNLNKKLAIDPEESKIVQLIFDLYIKGLGTAQIAAHLNGKGIKTRYQKTFKSREVRLKTGINKKGDDFSWSDATVQGILKNTLYIGQRKYQNEVIKVPAIIETIQFEQVQLMLKNRNNRPIRTIKNDNYLKGLVVCGKCGQPFFMHKRKDNKDAAYKCLSKKLQYSNKMEYCGTPSVGIDKLLLSLYTVCNQIIWEKMKTRSLGQHITIEEKISLKKIEIDNLKIEIKKFEKKETDLIDLLTDGTISKTQFKVKKAEYEETTSTKTDQLTKEIALLTELQGLKKKPTREYYTESIFKNNIHEVVRKVVVNRVPTSFIAKASKVFNAKNDLGVKITVETTNNDLIEFIVSRYTDKIIHLQNGKVKLIASLKNGAIQGHRIHDIIINKIKKAA